MARADGSAEFERLAGKAGVPFSTLWSETLEDDFFIGKLKEWVETHTIPHDLEHVRALNPAALPPADLELGRKLARALKQQKIILGIFNEGCMGMYNAILDDEMLNPAGFSKSGSASLPWWPRCAP